MNCNKIIFLNLSIAFLASCSSDDNRSNNDNFNFYIPETYAFTNDAGESTVSFSGQSTRLKQGTNILSDLINIQDPNVTAESIFNKLNNGKGFNTDSELNASQNIKDKIAESIDYFASNSAEQAEIRGIFGSFITKQATTFLEPYSSTSEIPLAKAGTAGILGNRLVNEKGLEYNQAFNKGLIGALTLDQIINDYLSLTERSAVRNAHNNNEKDEDNPYTKIEHFWDEAYGYLYGASDNDVLDNPNIRHLEKANVVDSFLYKYVQRVNADKDFNTYADEIYQAFKTGRAAITAKDYEASEIQANIIRLRLSEVIAIRAVFYMQQGKNKIIAGDNGNAFHDLSEGYGFVYSLRFTQNPITSKPYFSKKEVDELIAQLNEGTGFWKFTTNQSILNEISSTIASRFNFTVQQAAE